MGKIKAPVAERRLERLARSHDHGHAHERSMHAVGGVAGLYLSVGAQGRARSWILRYSFGGKRRDLGLGSHRKLSLADARDRAREQHKLISQGIDPLDAKREQRAERAKRMTFSQCVEGHLGVHGGAWKNPRHLAVWRSTLERYAYPVLGAMDVAKVTTPLVLKVLEAIWRTKTETATRLRARIESVLAWATVRGYRQGENVARWKGHLDQLLAKPSAISTVKHFAALPYREVGAFMAALRKEEGIGAKALEFAVLTAARSGEVRGMVWDEVDLDTRTWAIPAERMKAAREHRVPLSDAAVALLKKMSETRLAGEQYVFPGSRTKRPLSDMSLSAVLRRMGRGGLTVHGFRSTFRDWAAERTNSANHVVEMALAHAISDKVEAAYLRSNLFQKRARLMSDWAAYCDTVQEKAGAVVVAIRKRASSH